MVKVNMYKFSLGKKVQRLLVTGVLGLYAIGCATINPPGKELSFDEQLKRYDKYQERVTNKDKKWAQVTTDTGKKVWRETIKANYIDKYNNPEDMHYEYVATHKSGLKRYRLEPENYVVCAKVKEEKIDEYATLDTPKIKQIYWMMEGKPTVEKTFAKEVLPNSVVKKGSYKIPSDTGVQVVALSDITKFARESYKNNAQNIGNYLEKELKKPEKRKMERLYTLVTKKLAKDVYFADDIKKQRDKMVKYKFAINSYFGDYYKENNKIKEALEAYLEAYEDLKNPYLVSYNREGKARKEDVVIGHLDELAKKMKQGSKRYQKVFEILEKQYLNCEDIYNIKKINKSLASYHEIVLNDKVKNFSSELIEIVENEKLKQLVLNTFTRGKEDYVSMYEYNPSLTELIPVDIQYLDGRDDLKIGFKMDNYYASREGKTIGGKYIYPLSSDIMYRMGEANMYLEKRNKEWAYSVREYDKPKSELKLSLRPFNDGRPTKSICKK